jgi:putative ABC transport system permease protein
MRRKLLPLIESARMGMKALKGDRLRTFLSLLGVTIGIFSIISVFTLVDTLERNLQQSVQALGEDVLFVQKWPWAPEGEYEWWEYLKRPQPRIAEFEKLEGRLPSSTSMAFMAQGSKDVRSRSSRVKGVSVRAVTHGFNDVRQLELRNGRYFSPLECQNGRSVIVLGAGIAENLFPHGEALRKEVTVGGRKLRVVGVIEKEGSSLIGFSMDNTALIPYLAGTEIFPVEGSERSIMIDASGAGDRGAFKEEVRGAMRSIRRTPPGRDDSFALNSPSLISENLNELFGRVDIAGAIIGLFSILVGGFSIANIMFVSVKERTPHIGIQKALGAKRSAILSQFLLESVFLCTIGGGVGLLLVFLLGLPVGAFIGTPLLLSLENVLIGLGLSVGIGVLSGLSPAFMASRLDPVEAIRA